MTSRLLFELDRASNFLQLLLNVFSFSLSNSFLDWLRCPINQILGLLEAETSKFAYDFNYLNLLVTGRCQHDVELVFLGLRCRRRGAASSGRDRRHSHRGSR